MTKKQQTIAKQFAQTIAKEHGFSFKQTEMVLLETGGCEVNEVTFDYVMFGFCSNSEFSHLEYQAYRNENGTSTFTEYKNCLENYEKTEEENANNLPLSEEEKQAFATAILPPMELSLSAFELSGFEGSFNDWFATLSLDDMFSISKQAPKDIEVLSPSQTALVVDSVMVSAPNVSDLDTATLYIKNEIAGVANSFCRIGFKLYEVNRNNLFKLANLNNIYEYAEQYLGFKKSSTANYISICKRFSIKDEKGLPTSVLADNFESFSYTQLSEMLTLPAEKIEEISPDMTIKEIRLAKSGADSSEDIAEKTEENAGLYAVSIFDRKLTEKNIDLVIKLLRENIGKDIQITTF